jgi:membrane complex biogenesis BtpA family protein
VSLQPIFGAARPVIGMLHAPALPGSPGNTLGLEQILRWVLRDAQAYTRAGVHGLLLENFGDAPFYPDRVLPHTVAFLAVLGREVRARFRLPLGINVLRNDAHGALAVAAAAGAEFVRVNVYIGARLTDQGIVQGKAHSLLRYRKLLGAEVKVFADVAVKHSRPLAPENLREEVSEALSRGRADAVIVSGAATGRETDLEDLQAAKEAAGSAPVLAGSGVTAENAAAMLRYADGLIVGTALKRKGVIASAVDPARVRRLLAAVTPSRTGRE